MAPATENPGALAGTRRADVTHLTGKCDASIATPSPRELQVRQLIMRYGLSHAVATVIAKHIFGQWRRT